MDLIPSYYQYISVYLSVYIYVYYIIFLCIILSSVKLMQKILITFDFLKYVCFFVTVSNHGKPPTAK